MSTFDKINICMITFFIMSLTYKTYNNIKSTREIYPNIYRLVDDELKYQIKYESSKK